MKAANKISIVIGLFLAFSVSGCFVRSTTTTTSDNASAGGGTNANANTEPAGTPNAGAAQSAATLPETLVSELYKAHDAKKSPFFQTKDRALVDKYFAKPLADLIWKDATTAKNEVGAIDADPLYAAQDTEIKNFAVGKGEVKGDKATVAVTFTNFDRKVTITYSLATVNGGWKIDNILYGEGDSLMKWLKETYDKKPETSPTGAFQGTFQVGPTTCTVKPVKMAFEVRWAKGSGSEMFFFKDGNTFETEPKDGETNSFVFDDESYNTGTFYRADGTTFPVKRVK